MWLPPKSLSVSRKTNIPSSYFLMMETRKWSLQRKNKFHFFKNNPISFVLERNHLVYLQVYIFNIEHSCTKVFFVYCKL